VSASTTTSGVLLGVGEFAAALQRPGTTLIDVRTPEEFATGHLDGAVNIDLQGAGFGAAVADLDPSGTYAVYCRSGNRSAVAVAYLQDHGFDSVFHLDGGIVAWQAAGQPVTTS
jgi:rhodanese-related sulfurtransferase